MKVTEDLAEFIGILIGDGHIAKDGKEISIVENKLLDISHMKHTSNLIKRLFGITPKIYLGKGYHSGAVRCKFYSKKVQEFLIKYFGFQRGNKMEYKLEIPKQFFSDKKLLAACLRGIFDTDGGIYHHRRRDPMIEIDSYNVHLKHSIVSALKTLGFTVTFSGRRIYIYAKNEISKFFEIVGSNNLRNNYKYQVWKTSGNMLKTKELVIDNIKIYEKISIESKNKMWVIFEPDEIFKKLNTDNYISHAPIV